MNICKIMCFCVMSFLMESFLYGQEVQNLKKADPQNDYYLEREKFYETSWLRDTRYYDADADSLDVSQSEHEIFFDYQFVFFRRTPLSFKTGWTNVFSLDEVDLGEIYGFGGRGTFGKKGYNITWILINDSIFIKDITLRANPDRKPEDKELSRDTIISRIENFTNRTFQDSLLFADWISDDFGVITKHKPNINITARNSLYRKAIEEGIVITFDNGKVVKIEEDTRRNRN